MSDFHEMATHLRIQEERSLLMEHHGYRVGINRIRSRFGQQRFSYSDQLKVNKVGIDLRILSENKIGKKSDA